MALLAGIATTVSVQGVLQLWHSGAPGAVSQLLLCNDKEALGTIIVGEDLFL